MKTKNFVSTWTIDQTEKWRRKSMIGMNVSCTFTPREFAEAEAKLAAIYPKGNVNPSFVEKMLIASEVF